MLEAMELGHATAILVGNSAFIRTHSLKYLFHLGGGFFVRYHGLWALRGIVSSGSSKAEGGCDVGRYSLFTNVLDYVSWIDKAAKKINSIKSVVS